MKKIIIVNVVLVAVALAYFGTEYIVTSKESTQFEQVYNDAKNARAKLEQYAEQTKREFDEMAKQHETKKPQANNDVVNKAVDKFTVIVYNLTNKNLVGIYGSTSGSETWEENIIGGDIIVPGKSFEVTFDDGSGECVYDLKAVYDTGESLVETGIDICKTNVWKIYEAQ